LTIGPRQLRGGVAAAELPSADPSLGGSRSAERGCTGRAGRCSRPRRTFGFRRRRAPSVRRRRRGVCHCFSASPCLDCSPAQAGQTLLGFAIPRRVVVSGRLTPARVLLSCRAGCGGWAGWAWPEGLGPTGARAARPPTGPGGRLAVTELLAQVCGSSVSLNWPCADQGGRHVDMVVGPDHRGRAGVGVWRDAATGPLTALRQQPRSRPALLLERVDGQVAALPVGSRPSGRGRPSALLGPAGSGAQLGLGSVVLGHREQFVAGRPRRWASRCNCLVRVRAAPGCRTWDRCGAAGDVAGWLLGLVLASALGMWVDTPEDCRTVWRSL
jgi:hypothetical protein